MISLIYYLLTSESDRRGLPPKYLLWLFKSRLFRKFVDSLNTGSLIQHMFTSQIEKFNLPLPPINEQRRIVTKIEALKARSQRVKEELEAIPALLDQFRSGGDKGSKGAAVSGL